ncbi:MAG: GNAT family N-acetyltransferase, partial [Bacteroidota bacterium]
MELKIREAEQDDLRSLIVLYSQPDMDDGQAITLEKAAEILAKTKEYPFYKIFVAVLKEESVGTFELLIMDSLAHRGKPSGIIEDVVVAEKYRRKGIGRAMMLHAVKICREMDCYKVSLSNNVKRENAHRFYDHWDLQNTDIVFIWESQSATREP